jgi:transposase-like protein
MNVAEEKEAFRVTTDAIAALGISLADVAAALGVIPNTLSRWRADTDPRRPRSGWRADLAVFARARAARLREQADALASLATGLSDA